MKEDHERRFSNKLYVTEFGRYEGEKPSEYPENKILVGREKQRSKLLQLLFNRGKGGVYLVTGYRGSGKSSFVQYCVNEFKSNIYDRFLNSQIGRIFWWDQILFLFFSFFVIAGSLLLSQLVGATIEHTFSNDYSYRWILITPFFLINCFWFFAAKSLFEIALHPPGGAGIKIRWYDKLRSLLLLIAAIFFGYYIAPIGSPAVGISRLILALSWLYCWNYLFSVKVKFAKSDQTINGNYYFRRIYDGLSVIICYSLVFAPGSILGFSIFPNFWFNILFALLFICFTSIIRSIDFKQTREQPVDGNRKAYENASRNHSYSASFQLLAVTLITFMFATFSLINHWYFGCLLIFEFALALLMLVVGFCSSKVSFYLNKARSFLLQIKINDQQEEDVPFMKFVHKPRTLLGFEGVVLLVIGFQLATPWFQNDQLMFDLKQPFLKISSITSEEILCANNNEPHVTHVKNPISLACIREESFAKQGANIFAPGYVIDEDKVEFKSKVKKVLNESDDSSFVLLEHDISTDHIMGVVHKTLKHTNYLNNKEFILNLNKEIDIGKSQNLKLKKIRELEFQIKNRKLSSYSQIESGISALKSFNVTKGKELGKLLYNEIAYEQFFQTFYKQVDCKDSSKNCFTNYKDVIDAYSQSISDNQMALKGIEEALKEKKENLAKNEHKKILFSAILEASQFGEKEELYWIASLIFLLVFIKFIEHEWIVRAAGELKSSLLFSPGKRPLRKNISFRNPNDIPIYIRYTFFYWFYKVWLPVLEVKINLGFDRLEYKKIVEAMLTGLSDVYYSTFLAWNSAFGNTIRVIRLFVLLMATILLSNLLFEIERGNLGIEIHSIDQYFKSELKSKAEKRQSYYIETIGTKVHDITSDIKAIAINQLDINQQTYISPTELKEKYYEVLTHLKSGNETEIKKKMLAEIQAIKFNITNTIDGTLLNIQDAIDHEEFCSQYPSSKPYHHNGINFKISGGLLPLLCDLGGNKLISFFHMNLIRLTTVGVLSYETTGNLMELALPYYEGRGIEIRLYHLIIFLTLLIFYLYLRKYIGFTPHHRCYKQMIHLRDRISKRMGEEENNGGWNITSILSIEGSSSKQRKESDPADPRTIEIDFLKILEKLQREGFSLPGGPSYYISLPCPKIIFVFDELDKVGSSINFADLSIEVEESKKRIDVERQRMIAINQLLTDMKNMLATSPAIFIFVGGRDLHDEWLADQIARRPLLTRIFHDEIYLPSLMVDHISTENAEFTTRIRFYLEDQLAKAKAIYWHWKTEKTQAAWLLLRQEPQPPAYMERPEIEARTNEIDPRLEDNQKRSFFLRFFRRFFRQRKGERRDSFKIWNVWRQLQVKEITKAEIPEWSEAFMEEFIQFLTFRSLGNAKTLNEFLEDFIEPKDLLLNSKNCPTINYKCEHMLAFPENSKFRIQLIADFYRHLCCEFEPRMIQSDDKLVTAIFYIADFLCKFHSRAFSWNNLQRIDEMLHIYRTPKLRTELKNIISNKSERYMHPIRNGMYDYRFRSDVAKEIRYISGKSELELAAFNFTLDESQTLKIFYTNRITESQDNESYEYIAALGELHEFDEEYESARYHYRKAIQKIDANFSKLFDGENSTTNQWNYYLTNGKEEQTGNSKTLKLYDSSGHFIRKIPEDTPKGLNEKQKISESSDPVIAQILSGEPEALEKNKNILLWGLSRLRLMLHIGMTYELSQNLEKAGAKYQDAQSLAAVLIQSALDELGRIRNPNFEYANDEFEPNKKEYDPEEKAKQYFGRSRVHALKNLQVLFQPAFAAAWVSEKMTSGVDAGPAHLEHFLWKLRNTLPFVRDPDKIKEVKDPPQLRNRNFALIVAEIHNKMADMYFFKGRQVNIPLDDDTTQPLDNLTYIDNIEVWRKSISAEQIRKILSNYENQDAIFDLYNLKKWIKDFFSNKLIKSIITKEENRNRIIDKAFYSVTKYANKIGDNIIVKNEEIPIINKRTNEIIKNEFKQTSEIKLDRERLIIEKVENLFIKYIKNLFEENPAKIGAIFSEKCAEKLIKALKTENLRRHNNGYLPMAYIHYVSSLHELRRYNFYRREVSKKRLTPTIFSNPDKQENFSVRKWPEFVSHAVAGSLDDMAETMLGQISILGLISCMNASDSKIPSKEKPVDQPVLKLQFNNIRRKVQDYLEKQESIEKQEPAVEQPILDNQNLNGNEEKPPTDLEIQYSGYRFNLSMLSDWFGIWSNDVYHDQADSSDDLVQFIRYNNDLERLFSSIMFSLVSGSLLERVGFFHEAAEIYLQVLQVIENYVWWRVTLKEMLDLSFRRVFKKVLCGFYKEDELERFLQENEGELKIFLMQCFNLKRTDPPPQDSPLNTIPGEILEKLKKEIEKLDAWEQVYLRNFYNKNDNGESVEYKPYQEKEEWPYWDCLLEIAIYAAKEMDNLFHHCPPKKDLDHYNVGKNIPAAAVTTLCSLSLAFLHLLPGRFADTFRLQRRFKDYNRNHTQQARFYNEISGLPEVFVMELLDTLKDKYQKFNSEINESNPVTINDKLLYLETFQADINDVLKTPFVPESHHEQYRSLISRESFFLLDFVELLSRWTNYELYQVNKLSTCQLRRPIRIDPETGDTSSTFSKLIDYFNKAFGDTSDENSDFLARLNDALNESFSNMKREKPLKEKAFNEALKEKLEESLKTLQHRMMSDHEFENIINNSIHLFGKEIRQCCLNHDFLIKAPEKWFRRVLTDTLNRHSYPLKNRLHGLKVLIDDAVLREEFEREIGHEDTIKNGERVPVRPDQKKQRERKRKQRWFNYMKKDVEELIDYEVNYAAPSQFTPLAMGVTIGMFYLKTKDLLMGDREFENYITDIEKYRNTARTYLLKSQEMYTMRRSYYESISDLYYLYNDFNDRQVHFQVAIQMASAELSFLLTECLNH